ncbi:NADPH-dependent FMN reductase [Paenibacillus oenotherae]|uniref:NADPH-dependent FMN reductase n=1 Tax=Paenibacillus oenotherae TaxID=1435645 RepID=A0ABS7DAP2_9BACL|nr:NADPH-dependent FMN reductase [Paenibacillus oenotherae]MBW7477002.1 NADPH-dependent FMN reductase [Paenibacillus oenotherae]
MPKVVIVTGSPNAGSRLNGISGYVEKSLQSRGWHVDVLPVVSLPAEDLILTRWDSPAITKANLLVEEADAVIIASPVYKASYSGVLKTYLDLLPQKGLEGKIVLPLFIGGTISHLLAIDYALKPVLSALYARHISQGVYAVDSQVQRTEQSQFVLDEDLTKRLDAAIGQFAEATLLFTGQAEPLLS